VPRDGLRTRLKRGECVFGSVLTQPTTLRSALIWAEAGLDFIVVDTEHPPVDRQCVGELTAAFACVGVTPLVRIASRDPDEVHRTLDAGAHGVLVPYCETRAQVQALVDAVRLRPIKGLLLENGGRAIPRRSRRFVEQNSSGYVVAIGIESVPALNNLAAVLAIPGIDALHVGPWDLSISLGVPGEFTHPKMRRAFATILAEAERRGVAVGIWPLDAAMTARWMRRGMRFVMHGTDQEALEEYLANRFGRLRKVRDARRSRAPAHRR
jgi:2-keto-3-deoxy-L-rhamnonate aldolase RhmA